VTKAFYKQQCAHPVEGHNYSDYLYKTLLICQLIDDSSGSHWQDNDVFTKLAIVAIRKRPVDQFMQGRFGDGSMRVVRKVSALWR